MAIPPVVILGALGLFLTSTASPGLAQDSGSTGDRSTLEGVYSESQASKGQETYRKYCTECHTPRTVSGTAFKKVWAGRTIYDYYALLRSTMPEDEPGKLSPGQYAEIIAYLLRLSGYPAGERELPGEEEALIRIRIDTAAADGGQGGPRRTGADGGGPGGKGTL